MLENLAVVPTSSDAADVSPASGLPLESLLGASRAAIVVHLHRHSHARTNELAELLGVSETATRRHLANLEEDGFVAGETRADGPGRPAWHYRLTPRGRDLFPQRYAAVADELIEFVQTHYGDDGLDAYLAWRRERQTELLGGALTGDDTSQRLDELAAALSDAGYAAEVSTTEDGEGFELKQQHCAIAHLAEAHPELCSSETEAFAALLGREVSVTRTLTIANGDDACVCHVVPAAPDADRSPHPAPHAARGTEEAR